MLILVLLSVSTRESAPNQLREHYTNNRPTTQCYFLASATPATILYHIERIRDGRSYVTRGVRAYQNGKMVFVIICSFQKPEVWQVGLTHRPPPDVPPPDQCEHAMDVARRQANEPGVKPHIRDALMEYVHVRIAFETVLCGVCEAHSCSGL